MTTETRWDTIVVGGGFAGVAAARELRHAGRSVLLLEARDRVGGRTYTTERGGRQVELGGAFVHWWQGQSISEVMRYGLDVEFVPFLADRCHWPIDDGSATGGPDELNATLLRLLDTYFADAEEVFPRPFEPLFAEERVRELDHQSARDRLEQLDVSPAERDLLAGVLCSMSSGLTDAIGLLSPMRWFSMHRWSSEQFMGREHYRIKGGIVRLIEAMLADANCDVRLESPVASVSDGGDCVSVTLRDGTAFQARSLVLAVPLAALGAIELPADIPPSWRRVAAEGSGSTGLKLILRAPAGTPSVFAIGRESAPVTWLITESQGPDDTTLVGFGPDASRIDGTDLEAVRAAIAEIAPGIEVLDAQQHDWGADEFAQGTWGFLRPGQLSQLAELRHAHGRLVLAGADLAASWVAFVCGAIESGIHAARQAEGILARGREEVSLA
jgi:monoamine oxidase